MNLIVAVDENLGIGFQGDLLVKISEDLKYFKQKTINNVVVMGRITFESLPNKKPLPKRVNVILTRDQNFTVPHDESVIVCHTIEEVINIAKQSDKETFIIGGEQIYQAFLPYCHKAYITKIYDKFKADKHIANFMDTKEWRKTSESEIYHTDEGVKFQFIVYEAVDR